LGSWQSLAALLSALLIAYAVILLVGMGIWTYRDIRQRTHDGWSQAVAVALVVILNIPGLVLYLVIRPGETLTEAYERRLETEALLRELPERRTCPRCDRVAREEFLLCPHCRTVLREPCLGCGRALELEWSVCPFCGASGPQAVRAATSSPPASLQHQSAPPPFPKSAGASTPQAPHAAGTTPSTRQTGGPS
jgi:RNA polymerase subunit RPABC4/transcription elongation factor Spt4